MVSVSSFAPVVNLLEHQFYSGEMFVYLAGEFFHLLDGGRIG
jgi:hypothetical protein